MKRSIFGVQITHLFFVVTLVLAVAVAGSVRAAAPADAPVATVKKFIDDFNKGDLKGAASTQVDDVAIIDEFPPHAWNGSGAWDKWLADLQKDAKTHEQSDQKMNLGKTIRSQVDGDTAYVVMAATFVYKEKGKAMTEPGQMALALKKDGDSWKIASWAWAGTPPRG
jgi:ketosteroid isomerase-like protein